MAETNQEENYHEKEVAFYSATVNAWYTTKLEKDKHLLGLASAGIGLLVTLAAAIGVPTVSVAAMYIAAMISFLICILVVLNIFDRNADYLEKMFPQKEEKGPALNQKKEKGSPLKMLDKIASYSFIFGIIFTLSVGLLSGIEKFNP